MKKLGLVQLILIIFALPFKAQAQSMNTYVVKYHFSENAWGKVIKSVLVHTGILAETKTTRERNPSLIWVDVKDLPMVRRGDHFFAKTLLQWSSDEESLKDFGPIVEYWIQFEDGTSTITQKHLVTVLKSDSFADTPDATRKAQQEIHARLFSIQDATSTSADKIAVEELPTL